MKRRLTLLGSLLVLAVLFVGFGPRAYADGPTQASPRELALERSLACPQCTDLPLDVCDNDICTDMRAIIKQKIAAGESDQAIRQYFVERYGSRVLLAPSKSNFAILMWLAPFFALGLGGLAVYLFLRSAHGRRAGPSSQPREDLVLNGYRAQAAREAEEYE